MKVHFIAIGGSAMHNLAIALKQNNLDITGSDDEIFEPSKSRLAKYNLLPFKNGWDTSNIHNELDYVILGMHARKDNPELLKAQELGLKILSYPEFLYQQSKNKTRVVIAGSHGKTSITAMILHVFSYHDLSTDFMVGAQLNGYETMVKFSPENEFMLLEGDEYLSSPIDLRPKFIHYKANIALISGIAWDHINVFPSFENYLEQFNDFISTIEVGGALVYNESDPTLKELVLNHPREIKKFPYSLPDYSINDDELLLHSPEGNVPLEVFGEHNMLNLEGARWVCNQMGVTDEQFYEAISSFTGASRRLEKIENGKNIIAYRDFAHAPSKLKATVDAVSERHPSKKTICLFELHTFSSLNSNFIGEYKNSMSSCDNALIYYNPQVVEHKKLPVLDKKIVKDAFGGDNVKVFNNQSDLLKQFAELKNSDSVIVIMSSGNFDGVDWKSQIEQ